MTTTRHTFITLAAVCLFAAATRAQTPIAPVPLSADELSGIISPHIDNQTLLIAHLDTAQIDLAAGEAYLSELLDAGHVPVGDQNRKQLAQVRLVADAYLSKFQSLGGRHVIFILSQADLWPFVEPPVTLLIPVEKGTDPKALLDFLNAQPIPPEQNMTAEMLDGSTIFFGTKHSLAHLKSLTPQSRPELLAAIASAPDAALQVGYAPTPDMRRVISEMMPAFPADSPIMPGASTDFLSTNVKHVSIAVALPPTPSFTLSASMDSPRDADQMREFAKALIQFLRSNPDYQKAIATTDPDYKPQMDALQLLLKDVEASLDAANGTAEVTIRLDAAELRTFFQFAEPAFAAERERAASIRSMNSIKRLLFAGNVYASDHKGEWPATLKDLANATGENLPMSSPDDPSRPYAYHFWTAEELKKLNPAVTPVIWETADGQRAHIPVGFLDGHVELLKDQTDLDERLKQAEQLLQAK